ncbi:hypothetical protein [Brevibacillus borstelensis]|uniref:hypothetical protein n=1 Tax=Brevibacillus borstelensis TaxID=45462 RepID=UPI0030BC0A40
MIEKKVSPADRRAFFTTLLTAALFYGLGYGITQPSIQAWMIKQVASAFSYAVMCRLSSGCMVLFLGVYLLSQFLGRRAKAKVAREEIGVKALVGSGSRAGDENGENAPGSVGHLLGAALSGCIPKGEPRPKAASSKEFLRVGR